MRLYSFQIRNFKSIINTKECKISEIDNIVILAGQNESGKTSVLEALDFFANGPSERLEKFQKRTGTSELEVKCRFILEPVDIEYFESALENYSDVINFLKQKKQVLFARRYENGEDKDININEGFFDDFPEIKYNEEKGEEPSAEQEAPSETQSEPAGSNSDQGRDELISKVKKTLTEIIPTFSFYNSFNDLLPSEILVSELESSKAVQDFEKVFDVSLKELAGISDTRERTIKRNEIQYKATDDFNKSWNQTISTVAGNEKYSFLIEVNDGEPKKIIFMIEGEDEIPLYLEQKSMGFRWFSAFHLRLRALMKQSEGDSFKEDIVILIDEPGQHLHDVAQKDVKKILNKTAGKGIQIIYSTHNPNLIADINTNEIEFTRIRIVSNDKRAGTQVFTLPQYIASKDSGSIDALSPIRTAMGLNSTGSIFDQNKFNVVVEGITDNYYLTALRMFYNYDNRIHFIPVCGVDNVKSLVGLLIGWGMNYKAVFDDDPNQGRKAYNNLKKYYFENDDALAHENILKLKGCHGIEDIFSKSDFKKYIYTKKLTPTEKTKSNSELVKEYKKELVAKEFLESVRKDSSKILLDDISKKKIAETFTWLYKRFEIKQ